MSRARSDKVPLPCGCLGTQGYVLHLCPEAERLWAAFRALGAEHATALTPEYRAYQAHFKPKRGKG
jgi:hypothetical protein